MSNKYLYVTDRTYFCDAVGDPVTFNDHKLKNLYPDFYVAKYDLKLLAAKMPTKEERDSPIYNDYLEKVGSNDIEVLKRAAESAPAKNVLLNSFNNEQFRYISPYIKDSTELLYLFKCRRLSDLSPLSQFKKLKCVLVFGNYGIRKLWDMSENEELRVLSFDYVSNLSCVKSLVASGVEYFSVDSSDNLGRKKFMVIEDTDVFEKMPALKYLKLEFKDCKVDY